jgi:hypothetical protein
MLDFENDMLVLLSDVARHMRTCANQLAQQHGMTFAQLTILARLEGDSPTCGNPDGATSVSAGGLMWDGRSASEWGGG